MRGTHVHHHTLPGFLPKFRMSHAQTDSPCKPENVYKLTLMISFSFLTKQRKVWRKSQAPRSRLKSGSIEHEQCTRNYPQSRLPPTSANASVPQVAYPLAVHSFHSKRGISNMKCCGQQRRPWPCVRLLHRLGPVPSPFCLPNLHDKQSLLKEPLIRRPIFPIFSSRISHTLISHTCPPA